MCDLTNLMPRAVHSATEDDNDNDVVTTTSMTNDREIASILIVEHDEDCADALDAILSDLPGITSVRTVGTASDALSLLDTMLYDVLPFGMLQPAPAPDVIFIGAHLPDSSSDAALKLHDAVSTFRERLPNASLVLLCVYPGHYCDALGGLVDGCIRKDTSARELTELIDILRTSRQRS